MRGRIFLEPDLNNHEESEHVEEDTKTKSTTSTVGASSLQARVIPLQVLSTRETSSSSNSASWILDIYGCEAFS